MNETLTNFRQAVSDSSDLQDKIKGGADLVALGKEKGSGEWTLVCLAYNLRRLHRLVRDAKNGVPKPQPPSTGWNSLRISLARE